MNDDDVFRIVLGAGLLLVLPVAGYFRFRSHQSGEKLDRMQEGLFILVALRLCGVLGAAGLIAWLVNPELLGWSALPLPPWARWVGVGILGVAAVLLTWTLSHLGKNLTDTVVTRKEHTLVTSGPYRWVRHPFYVTGLVGTVSITLITANAYFAALGAVGLALLALRTPKEEANLIARFGDDYRAYMRRTGRFFPRLGTRPDRGR
jgi:protein-S-isoprenylcysteine O-methyltransferase Ste14